jgi:SAM-dependent methyltransferase
MTKRLASEGTLHQFYQTNMSPQMLDKIGNKWFGSPPADFLEMKKYISKASTVLEVGSAGWRFGIYILTDTNIKKYIGLEIIDKFTTYFKKKIAEYKVYIQCKYEFLETSFLSYNTNEKIDTILFIFSVIEEFKNKKAVFQKVKELLSIWWGCIIDMHDYRYPVATIDTSKVRLYPLDYKKNIKLFEQLWFSHKQICYECPWKNWFAREMIILKKKRK